MPRLDYFLVAESVSIDKDRSTLSIFHVCDAWQDRPPLLIPELVAVSSWTMEPEDMGQDFQATLKIRLPGKQERPDLELHSINFTADHRRQRTYHFVRGLRIEEPGEVEFRILLNGQHKASHYAWVIADEEKA